MTSKTDKIREAVLDVIESLCRDESLVPDTKQDLAIIAAGLDGNALEQSKPYKREADWTPGETLPPVGEICEFYFDGSWDKALILARDGDFAWVNVLGRDHVTADDPKEFRPIRTDRDKAVEAASKHLNSKGWVSRGNELASLYDAGLLRLPEGEE